MFQYAGNLVVPEWYRPEVLIQLPPCGGQLLPTVAQVPSHLMTLLRMALPVRGHHPAAASPSMSRALRLSSAASPPSSDMCARAPRHTYSLHFPAA